MGYRTLNERINHIFNLLRVMDNGEEKVTLKGFMDKVHGYNYERKKLFHIKLNDDEKKVVILCEHLDLDYFVSDIVESLFDKQAQYENREVYGYCEHRYLIVDEDERSSYITDKLEREIQQDIALNTEIPAHYAKYIPYEEIASDRKEEMRIQHGFPDYISYGAEEHFEHDYYIYKLNY